MRALRTSGATLVSLKAKTKRLATSPCSPGHLGARRGSKPHNGWHLKAATQATPPVWDTNMIPGLNWTDPKTGMTVTVPGLLSYHSAKRDPY